MDRIHVLPNALGVASAGPFFGPLVWAWEDQSGSCIRPALDLDQSREGPHWMCGLVLIVLEGLLGLSSGAFSMFAILVKTNRVLIFVEIDLERCAI